MRFTHEEFGRYFNIATVSVTFMSHNQISASSGGKSGNGTVIPIPLMSTVFLIFPIAVREEGVAVDISVSPLLLRRWRQLG